MIKLIDILKEIESNKILIPRRSEERKENINKKIQQYIKDGNKGDLNLSNSPFTSLPDNLLNIEGNFSLYNTPITFLPNNLQVNKNLYLVNTKITSLPDNLKVGNDLSLSGLKIDSIPNNLQVGKDLIIFDTSFSKKYTEEEIRKMIEDKGGFVKGKIYKND